MDLLTHLFLPLLILVAIRPAMLSRATAMFVPLFAILPDLDKLIGVPGLLHSLFPLLLLGIGVLLAQRWHDRRFVLGPILVAALASHLLLDILDGGPVPLLFPLVETGIGLEYPARTVFGEGLLGIRLEGPLVTLRTVVPRQGFLETGASNTYGLLKGTGIACLLGFVCAVIGRQRWTSNGPIASDGGYDRTVACRENRSGTTGDGTGGSPAERQSAEGDWTE